MDQSRLDVPEAQAAKLLDALHRLSSAPDGWGVVVVHLSRLQSQNRRSHHPRCIRSIFEPVAARYGGRIFVLHTGDVILLCKVEGFNDLSEGICHVRRLLSEDPLSSAKVTRDREGEMLSLIPLKRSFFPFLEKINQIAAEEDLEHVQRNHLNEGLRIDHSTKENFFLNENGFDETLKRTGVTPALHYETVCQILPGCSKLRPLFQELVLSSERMLGCQKSSFSLREDPWYTSHLSHTVDAQILSLLEKCASFSSGHAFSLNLSVSTLLSLRFEAFDENLPAAARGKLVIECQKKDIFSDIGAFFYARDYLHERGYTLCLDNITPLLLPHLNREKLGFDYLKLIWRPSTEGQGIGCLKELEETLDQEDLSRIILACCDTLDDIVLGQSLGISLFQGYKLDALLTEQSSRGGLV